jgi:hypothetical protein
MRIKKELIFPYIMATGIFNIIVTAILSASLCICFSNTLTLKMFLENYMIGYVILFILNINIIKE